MGTNYRGIQVVKPFDVDRESCSIKHLSIALHSPTSIRSTCICEEKAGKVSKDQDIGPRNLCAIVHSHFTHCNHISKHTDHGIHLFFILNHRLLPCEMVVEHAETLCKASRCMEAGMFAARQFFSSTSNQIRICSNIIEIFDELFPRFL